MGVHTCYVLSCIKYGDRDAVVKGYSKESGFQTYFIKSAFGAKSKYRSLLFLFNLVEISVEKEQHGKISSVSKCELIKSFYDYENVQKSSVFLFCADFLCQILQHENGNNTLFQLIDYFLRLMEENNPNAHLYLLFNLLKYHGLSPLLSDADYLNPETGLFSNDISSGVFSNEISAIWKGMIMSEIGVFSVKYTRLQRKQFLDSLIFYYQLHWDQFKVPKSLAVLKELYS